jgi:hypothetical protein
MKENRNLLAASLVANVVLAGAALIFATRSPDPAPQPVPPPVPKATGGPLEQKAAEKTVYVTNAAPFKADSPFDWQAVESDDYREYIANLRAIGCPEQTIKDIIVADVNKLFEERKKEERKGLPKFQFWKTGNPMAMFMDKDRMQANLESDKKKRELLKLLLGEDVKLKPNMTVGFDQNEMLNRMLGFLDEDKQVKVMETYQSFQLEMAEAFGGGVPDKEDVEKLKAKQKEMEQKLASMMSPEEYELYQLTMSQTGMMMRMQLDGLDPTEQEFRDIFKLQKSFDDEFGGVIGMAGMGPDDMKKRSEAEKLLKEDIKKLLGDERYTDYEMVSDWTYKPLAKVLEKQGLDKAVGRDVWAMKKAADAEVGKIRVDTNLSQEQRSEALKAIAEETRNAVRGKLGDKGFESYNGGMGGQWMKQLEVNFGQSTTVPAATTTVITN